MTTTTTGVDHGVTITEVQLPAGAPFTGRMPVRVLLGAGHVPDASRCARASAPRHRPQDGRPPGTKHEWEANEPTVVPPCPSWCRFTEVVPGKHDYDSVLNVDTSTYVRFHVSGQGGVNLAQEEFNRDGVVTFGPVHITIPERDGCEETTAEQARHMAAELLAAAHDLDQITGWTP